MSIEPQKTLAGFLAYDRMAEAYVKKNEEGAFNAHFERPSMLALLPPVRDLKILDLGTGPGGLACDLVLRGAHVTAVDGSEAMLAAARSRLGKRAEFLHLDLDHGLDGLSDSTFDVVVSSLTIHYISDLPMLAREIARVMVPGGILAVSTHHPLMDYPLSPSGQYFRSEMIADPWEIAGATFEVRFFRRPLSVTLQAFLDAGLALERVSEGVVGDELRQRFPEEAERISTKPFFIFFRFKKA
jgi:ubiquinone/menaquinone biosynthesis C-methylase UbiE